MNVLLSILCQREQKKIVLKGGRRGKKEKEELFTDFYEGVHMETGGRTIRAN